MPVARSRKGFAEAAGWLGIIGGILLVTATPLTLLLVSLLVPVAGGIVLFGGCGTGVHGLLGILAVKFGLDALRGEAEGGLGLIIAAVVAFVGAFFLLGGVFGILAGILLILAGVFAYAA